MWIKTPPLALPTNPQWTHPYISGGISVNIDLLCGEDLGHG
jgi:hypothetical protein